MTETISPPNRPNNELPIRDPITETPYLTVGGDSLPSIAERCGHAGEWLALADLNEGHVWGDWNNIQPGLLLDIPSDWLPAAAKPAPKLTTSSTKTGTSSTTSGL